MKLLPISALICLLCVTSCSRSVSSRFLAVFNPATTLSTIGGGVGITYFGGSAGTSSSTGLFSGVRIDKDWSFTFEGTHARLLDQLERFRAEVERQLSSSGATISGRGRWSGSFSGFSFDYTSGGIRGFVRVTGVSFETGGQGVDILVYEH